MSAASLGDPVFSGSVSSSSNSDKNITFATGTDENNNTTYPFFAAGSFKPDVQLPEVNLSVTVGSGAVSSITAPTYRNMFQASGVGFSMLLKSLSRHRMVVATRQLRLRALMQMVR